MRVLIFGGTTESRGLSRKLADRGIDVTVSVATAYGRKEQGDYPLVHVRTGRMDEEEMQEYLSRFGPDLVIDATHPYAAEVTANIHTVCGRCRIPLLRLLRPQSRFPADAMVVYSAGEAAEKLSGTEGRILLTTGSRELPYFSGLNPDRLYARVLPTAKSLESCARAGIEASHIIAMQGPFSTELNVALIHQLQIRCLVTKDGGKTGGFPEKMEAAEKTGVRPVIIARPPETGMSEEEILHYMDNLR